MSMNFRPFVALILPCLVGLNATETVQVPLAAIEPPQVSPVWTNGGETMMSLIVIAVVLDLLVSVTVCGSLVRPTITFPKWRASGERTELGSLRFGLRVVCRLRQHRTRKHGQHKQQRKSKRGNRARDSS